MEELIVEIFANRASMGGGGAMKLFVISDIHGDAKYFAAAAGLIGTADCVVISGDIAKNGDPRSAEEVLSLVEQFSSNIVAVHGNWDRDDVRDLLDERGYGVHGKGFVREGVGFFGVGGSSQTPMNTASEYSEEEIAGFLQDGYRDVDGTARTVLVSHVPPRRVRDRTFLGLRGGSRAVREFLENNRVDLCLTGHIHEAFGFENLSGCTVVNSGSFKKGRYSLVEIGTDFRVFQGKF
jgi:uncharacterized protein